MIYTPPRVKIGNEWYAIIPAVELNEILRKTRKEKILLDIAIERHRQNDLHPQELSLAMRFVTIMEEAGEVAEALQEENYKQVYKELIETASCAARMAEDVLNKFDIKGD